MKQRNGLQINWKVKYFRSLFANKKIPILKSPVPKIIRRVASYEMNKLEA